jgi:hypothetical protein
VDVDQQVQTAPTEAAHASLCLRDEEARPVQRILDHTWTKLAYDPYLPCTGQGFVAAPGAVTSVPRRYHHSRSAVPLGGLQVRADHIKLPVVLAELDPRGTTFPAGYSGVATVLSTGFR